MKNFKFVTLLFIVLFMFSCKNEKDAQNEKLSESEKIVNDFFVINLEVRGKKDPMFHVYYTEDKTLNFEESKTVWANFTNEANGVVSFKYDLPKDVLPNQLRLDFGVINIDGMVIDKIEVTYLDKSFNISESDIVKYFRPNEECTVYDAQTRLFKPLKAGSNISLYPTESLSVELEKLYK